MQTVSAASLATIGAKSTRWPDSPALQWVSMRQVIADCRDAVAGVGDVIDTTKADGDLTDQAKSRRISRAALDAIDRLDALPSMERAERLVGDFLQGQRERRPTRIVPPSTPHDVQVAAELRAWVARQKSSFDTALKLATDTVAMSAILTAPGFLSGLSDEATNAVRAAAEQAIDPDAVQIRKLNEDAIAECRTTIVQTKSRIGQIANLRKAGSGRFEPHTAAKAA